LFSKRHRRGGAFLIVARDAQDAKSGTQLNVVLTWVDGLRK
jgi:hypothetical protein